MNPALVISPRDNVATALETLEAGATILVDGGSVTVVERIPRGHKVAIISIARGDSILKYGSAIGTASADIAAGTHVHTHNVVSTRGRGDLAPRVDPSEPSMQRIAEPPDSTT